MANETKQSGDHDKHAQVLTRLFTEYGDKREACMDKHSNESFAAQDAAMDALHEAIRSMPDEELSKEVPDIIKIVYQPKSGAKLHLVEFVGKNALDADMPKTYYATLATISLHYDLVSAAKRNKLWAVETLVRYSAETKQPFAKCDFHDAMRRTEDAAMLAALRKGRDAAPVYNQAYGTDVESRMKPEELREISRWID